VDNPAGDAIGAALPRPPRVQKHYKALPYGEVAGAIEAVLGSEARVTVKLGFEFLVLTASRSGEVRGARWAEIDVEGGEWTIPAERMKSRREHRVPLSGRAREILAEAKAHAPRSELVFPSARGLVLPSFEFAGLLKALGVGAVPHGFRSSFRDWAAECTDAPRAVMEAALAHAVRNRAEAAYARSDLFERRRDLMERWAEYLAGRGAGNGA
ncbi:MAG: site-specific integrase, partial [Gemmatimonadota bacterium]|nr:site-specific integrase [Gemmatimonadota bacterium]